MTKSFVITVTMIVATCAPRQAEATRTADLIVVWAPGLDLAPLATIARDEGVALVDLSPHTAEPATEAMIKSGIEAYDALQLDLAWSRFEAARAELEVTGGAGVSNARLSDLFIYRGSIRTQRGDPEGAWEELVAAIVVAPARVFDPARFPPRTLGDLERARAAVGTTGIPLVIEASPACVLVIDGLSAGRETTVPRGSHWISARCPDRARWGRRIQVDDTTGPIGIAPQILEPPPESALLIQARTAAASGLIVVEVRSAIAVVRLLGLDGKERGRRTLAIDDHAPRALAPLAAAIRSLLAPAPRSRWYQSRWAWAAGGALALAAIVIPIAIVVSNDQPTGVKVTGPGALP